MNLKAVGYINLELLLNLYGNQGMAGQWSKSHLSDRKQKAEIKSSNSNVNTHADSCIVKHGVMQGSLLDRLACDVPDMFQDIHVHEHITKNILHIIQRYCLFL
jgi:hypothetical protein